MKTKLIFMLLFVPFFSMAGKRVSINEALLNKSISYEIKHLVSVPDSLDGKSGIKMLLSLQNKTQTDIDVVLESGRRFMSEDSLFQNLILTQQRIISMKAGQKLDYPIVSFCINASRKSPAENKYKIGSLAKGLLLQVANFLGKNNLINKSAQNAIWVISDNHSIQAVNGNSSYETRLVRNFLYDVTGQKRPPRSSDPLSYPEVALNGKIEWAMNKAGKINIFVLDKSGKQLGTLVNNRSFQSGNQIYTFHYLDDALIPEEDYTIKIVSEGILVKETVIKGKEKI